VRALRGACWAGADGCARSEVARKHALSPAELALAWCNSRDYVTSTIIGATSVEQLHENIGAFSKPLPEEADAEIEAIFRCFSDPTKVPAATVR